MTGHTSDEQLGLTREGKAPQERSSDSESALHPPVSNDPADRGVVQDSPGNPAVGLVLGGGLDEAGSGRQDSDMVSGEAPDQ